jgi:hypothetical protein
MMSGALRHRRPAEAASLAMGRSLAHECFPRITHMGYAGAENAGLTGISFDFFKARRRSGSAGGGITRAQTPK